jgi:hypothetical protein
MKLAELFEAWDFDKDPLKVATELLTAKGIKDVVDIKNILSMAKWHHMAADRVRREIAGQPVMIDGKLLTSKELFQLVTDVRKAIASAQSNAPVAAGTRHIEMVTDDKLAKMEAYVKAHNAANKKDRMRLSVYDRKGGKKIWIDGSVEAIAAFKKAHP